MGKQKFTWILVLVVLILQSCGGSEGMGIGNNTNIPSDPIPSDPEITYSAPINISSNETYSHYNTFTVSSDGVIHVFWIDNNNVLYSSSLDDGITFEPPEVVVPSSGTYSNAYTKTTHTKNAIHLTWTAYNVATGGAEVFYIRSIDAGNTFSVPQLVSTDDGLNSYASTVNADFGSRVTIAWSNQGSVSTGARFVVSENEGESFTTPFSLPAQQGISPRILLTPSVLYGTWTEGDAFTSEISFSKSTDGGINFDVPINISQYEEKSWGGEMALDDSGTIYYVWTEGSAFVDRKILLTKSEDGGNSFSTPVLISNPATDSFCPSIVSAGTKKFYITWSSSDDNYTTNRTYIVASNNGGMTYSPPYILSMLSVGASCPTIKDIGSDSIGIIWSDTGVGSGMLPDIFYSAGQVSIP